ncbi:GNAT family N-acetyltransferase [Bacillus sp. B19-2]|uniref:GNAT family N-acetyltransferase n=1 Tax=Bacillus sp. B19-2 TaxID=2929516 RepID=UPI001FB91E48|nr:GNAT family N-acetyltransferase [Bacillus sp. B19-2]MCJ2145889.1 acetyltransferase [Bacillus sp. B19-2]
MLFHDGKLKVCKLKEKDKIFLVKWLSDPFILEFYEGRDNPFNIDKVNEVFYHPNNDEVKCIVKYDGKEIGYIQFYQLDEITKKEYGYSDENIYGIDQFIGEKEYWNKGIGTQLVSSMLEYLVNQKLADGVIVDPQIGNGRALRCYEKCGFKKVRILPKHELHEGEDQDCWLMEYKRLK